ncbi:MAG: lytic transglycosylase domain-containing protein [Kiloniellales bacterium]|nr:lytic transglycosylase domain-containing protein [Kiloniellales bacterium]
MSNKDLIGQTILTWFRLKDENADYTFNEIKTFLETHSDWPDLTAIQRNAESLLSGAAKSQIGDFELSRWFQRHPPASPQGAIAMAELLQRGGKEDSARALIKRAWRDFHFEAADEKAFLQAFPGVITKEDHFARLDRLLYFRERSAAKRQAKRMGRAYQVLADARLALSFQQPGVDGKIKRVPAKLQNDTGLLYERIRWRYAKRRLEGVVELLNLPRAGQIDAERLWRIRRWAAIRLASDAKYQEAYSIISGHNMGTGMGLAECAWLAGWIAHFHLRRPDEAITHFEYLHDNSQSPISKARGAFWAAEAAEAIGDTEKTRSWRSRASTFTSSFYGQLAAKEENSFLPPVDGQPPSKGALETFKQRELIRVTGTFHRLGEKRLFDVFMRHLLEQTAINSEYRLLAAYASDIGRQDLALRSAKKARIRGEILPEILFPEPSISFGENGKTPEAALVLSVIRQESAFDPRAISRAGARGLMQLMPATAKRVARDEGTRFVRDWLTVEPDYNLRLGQAYLQQMIERYDGHYALALAAYNAGPHRVDRWLKTFGDPRDPKMRLIYWIEQIPFSETRNYVQRVLEALVIYRARRMPQFSWSVYPPNDSS